MKNLFLILIGLFCLGVNAQTPKEFIINFRPEIDSVSFMSNKNPKKINNFFIRDYFYERDKIHYTKELERWYKKYGNAPFSYLYGNDEYPYEPRKFMNFIVDTCNDKPSTNYYISIKDLSKIQPLKFPYFQVFIKYNDNFYRAYLIPRVIQ
ncbi:hypothetical protein MWN41_10995 [Ornithobacterium rhinotracheale]|uniref:hypothetical protein n=1 Tax=Ornithobacterium rhinotracheale TaxID=28251 RepID=UPI001FF53717|nr:hypothetical protein [Ornithobacterium rhinotracheale]MCK0203539.1 hypothetical protein [Ornithobacterium rhinotracheale]